jgi:LemA protein
MKTHYPIISLCILLSNYKFSSPIADKISYHRLGEIVFFALFTAIIILVLIIIYNSLIAKKNQVHNANGTLDAQLKQRYDLIPNLVSIVKQFMMHENEVLEKMTALRTNALNTRLTEQRKELINKELTDNLSLLLGRIENYPDLKSNANFLELQKKLYEIEENIAAARRFYNASVTDFNNAIEMIPSNLVAKMMGLKMKNLFNIPELEKKPHSPESFFTINKP